MQNTNNTQSIEEMQKSFWANLNEISERIKISQAELEKWKAENKKQRDEDRKQRDEDNAEYKRRRDEENAEYKRQRDKDNAEYKKRQEKLDKQLGIFGNNLGSIAEEYFFNSFENGKTNFFGEKFDEIEKNVLIVDNKAKKIDEFDILLINGTSIGIIEVKHKAHKNDIPSILNKITTFRNYFAYYENHKVYLGLASMAFYDELEDECKKHGIAIIKQCGDTLVIYDDFIKAY